MSRARPVCAIADLPDGGSRGFEPRDSGSDPIFIVRQGMKIRAYRDECPHQGSRLSWRRDEYLNHDRTRIVCWAHGAQFDVLTGICTHGACLGQRLTAVPSRIDEHGGIWLAE
jgi:nitrite reductase/ring-hydroxylating ferredoxin subunit